MPHIIETTEKAKMLSNYIDRIDAFAEDIKAEANAMASALERLAGELRVIADENQKVHLAIEVEQENDQAGIDAALARENASVDELPKLINYCEIETEDILKILTCYVPQVLQEITHTLCVSK